jgi:hypothetical protein
VRKQITKFKIQTKQNKNETVTMTWNIGGEYVSATFLQVVKEKPAFCDASDNGCKVVIGKNDISSIFSHVAS